MSGLYLHIPFCVRKCLYCDFYSEETGKGPLSTRLKADAGDQSDFLSALEIELDALPADFIPETIFLGGGTPTELSELDLDRLLNSIEQRVNLSRLTEWTCESNPGTLTRAKANRLKASRINRMSLGIQSFTAANLEFLGRIHDAQDAVAGYHLLREVGFDNINLDLIYGIPGSSLEATQSDVQKLIKLAPEHASCYCLTFEEDTPLMKLKQRGFVREVDDDEELDQYATIRSAFMAAGYVQYEISNFSKPGQPCHHNLLYWGGGEYIGCGPSAHSHWQGRRYANVRSVNNYTKALLDGRAPISFDERLPAEEKARETLVMWLRRLDGVPRAEFLRVTGYDYMELGGTTLNDLIEGGMLVASDHTLRLTEKGLFVSNRIFSELI